MAKIKAGCAVENIFRKRVNRGETKRVEEIVPMASDGENLELWINGGLCYISKEEAVTLMTEIKKALIEMSVTKTMNMLSSRDAI